MTDKRWKILYAGLDANTFLILQKDHQFNVCAASYIDKFQIFTWNPVNYLFKIIHLLRSLDKFYKLESILSKIWFVSMPFSSGIFYKYRNYIYTLSIYKLDIIDLKNIQKTVSYIRSENIELIAISVYPLLPKEIIQEPKFKSINIHPSILPQYRGSLPTLWSLKNHDEKSAVTYMIVDQNMDTGNIIAQHFFSISENDDWQSLENKIAAIIENTFVSDIKNYLQGILKPTEQNKKISPSKTAAYEKYRKIEWTSENREDIYNKINLYPSIDPGVCCYTVWRGRKVWFRKIERPKKNDVNKYSYLRRGDFILDFLSLFIICEDGMLMFRLFKDIDTISSIRLFFAHFGNF